MEKGSVLLKSPVWTWEVPAYFFVGGAAGAAAVIAAVAALSGADDALARHARWIAGLGAALSPPLLIADLGRPERFLNMLRVFKVQSPMSVGAWTLVVFSAAIFTAIACDWLGVPVVRTAADIVAALSGLVLATYTGVLIGTTVIPVWSAHVKILPLHFGASSLGAAVSLLELVGHRTPELNAIGIGAALIETVVVVRLEGRRDATARQLFTGPMGAVTRMSGILTGPIALVLRLAGGPARTAAAICTIIGSFLTRVGWLAAGRRPPAAKQP